MIMYIAIPSRISTYTLKNRAKAMTKLKAVRPKEPISKRGLLPTILLKVKREMPLVRSCRQLMIKAV